MAGTKDVREKAKSLWIKGMKAIGNTAASIANNTRYKVDEVTIQNRRREVLNDLAHKAYTLWLKGESFPEPMDKMLNELKRLDEQLNDIRAEKYASSGHYQQPDSPEEPERDDDLSRDTPEADDTVEDEDPFPLDDSPVSTEINGLFDGTDSVSKMAEKVNSSLDQMSERLRSFPRETPEETEAKRQE